VKKIKKRKYKIIISNRKARGRKMDFELARTKKMKFKKNDD
jgi:hypothetical protein